MQLKPPRLLDSLCFSGNSPLLDDILTGTYSGFDSPADELNAGRSGSKRHTRSHTHTHIKKACSMRRDANGI